MSAAPSERVLDLLVEGLDDWVSLHNVVWHGREQAADFGGDIGAAVRTVVSTLVIEGLMYPGELGETTIDPWRGGAKELVERVMRQCQELDWNPQGRGCWFANTPEGNRLAAEYLAAEREQPSGDSSSERRGLPE